MKGKVIAPAQEKVTSLLLEGTPMKKSLRLLLGTMILGAAMAAVSLPQNLPSAAGGDPVPVCPPDGCLAN